MLLSVVGLAPTLDVRVSTGGDVVCHPLRITSVFVLGSPIPRTISPLLALIVVRGVRSFVFGHGIGHVNDAGGAA